jgi:hypothetical protein
MNVPRCDQVATKKAESCLYELPCIPCTVSGSRIRPTRLYDPDAGGTALRLYLSVSLLPLVVAGFAVPAQAHE